jgi:hypothetical protein
MFIIQIGLKNSEYWEPIRILLYGILLPFVNVLNHAPGENRGGQMAIKKIQGLDNT